MREVSERQGIYRRKGVWYIHLTLCRDNIEKKGWNLFCKRKPPGFAVVVREFYANMIDMKEDSVYVRGIWVPMGHERINEVL